MSTSGALTGLVAALLTRISTRPKASLAAAASFRMSSASRLWAATASALHPIPRICSATLSMSGCLRLLTITSAPASANASAIAAPMPRLAPGTSATLPASERYELSMRCSSSRSLGVDSVQNEIDPLVVSVIDGRPPVSEAPIEFEDARRGELHVHLSKHAFLHALNEQARDHLAHSGLDQRNFIAEERRVQPGAVGQDLPQKRVLVEILAA